MGNVANNVQVAVTGGVYMAPAGTTIPTNGASALNNAFEDLGYISEAGVVETINEQSTDIRAWQNGAIVRKVTTSHDVTYAFTAIESNDRTLEAYYGNIAAGVVEVKGEQGVRGPWVIEVFDGAEDSTTGHRRIVIPDGQVTARGGVSYVNGAAVAYPITITAYPDDTGVKAYIYLDEEVEGS